MFSRWSEREKKYNANLRHGIFLGTAMSSVEIQLIYKWTNAITWFTSSLAGHLSRTCRTEGKHHSQAEKRLRFTLFITTFCITVLIITLSTSFCFTRDFYTHGLSLANFPLHNFSLSFLTLLSIYYVDLFYAFIRFLVVAGKTSGSWTSQRMFPLYLGPKLWGNPKRFPKTTAT